MSPSEELVIWIPARVMQCVTDPELGQYLMDTVLKAGLMPSKLSAADAAQHWAAMFMDATPKVRSLAHCSLPVDPELADKLSRAELEL